MKKIFLLLLKYMPIIQMVGILIGNTLCYFDMYYNIVYFIDFSCGNNLCNTIFIMICSFVFKFCNWHRYIIISNFINMSLAYYDIAIGFDLTNAKLLISYYIVATIFSLLAIYSKFHCNHVKLNEDSN